MKVGAGSRRAVLAAAMVWASGSAWAADVDIPAQGLAAALESLARQAHIQVLYSADLVTGLNSRPVKGALAPADALRTVLAGSGLDAVPTAEGNFAIVRAAAASQLDAIPVTAEPADDAYKAHAATIGGKVPVPVREIANSVSVLTRERMDDQGWADVDHALSWATGVDVRPNDTSQSAYYSRGFQLAFSHDGMPSWTPNQGFQELDLAMYERIEVLRGPSGLMQGSAEPAGTVNVVRKRPTDTAKASMTASAGSWNNYRTTADVSTPLTEDRKLKGRFVGTFTDRDYFYDEAHTQKWFGYGILEYTPTPDWTLSYSAAYQEDNSMPFGGVPTYSTGEPIGFSRSTNTMAPWSWSRWTTHEEKGEIEKRFANGWVAKASGAWQEQELDWKEGIPWNGVDRATDTTTYKLRDREFQYYRKSADAFVSGPFRLFGQEHSLTLGSNISMYNERGAYGTDATKTGVNIYNTGSLVEPTLPHTNGSEVRATQSGQYGQLRLRAWDPLLFVVGGRNTNFDSDNRSMSSSKWAAWSQGGKAKNEFTPYGGVIVDVTKQNSVYASYSEIFVPNTALTYEGNVLPPRKGWQAEVGTKNDLLDGAMQFSLAAFVLRDTNRSLADPAHSGYSIAAGEVESKGWETEITGRPVDELKLSAGYTYLITQSVNAGTSTGNTFQTWEPRHSVKLWGTYGFEDGPMEGWSFGSGVIAKSQTYSAQHMAHQNAYAVVDAQIGYKINDRLSATLSANNIFDNDYWAKMLSTTNNFYGDPRNFMLTLKAEM